MGIQQRLRGIFKTAKNNAKGLTLIEFSIVLAMTIALIGLVLSATGVFNSMDRYYLKQKTQYALVNYSADTTDTLSNASGGGWLPGGLLGTIETGDTRVMFSQPDIDKFCRLQSGAGQPGFTGFVVTELTYGQAFDGSKTMGSVCGLP